MQKVQKGFTLIELIVVIVLLGILGVTALGRFQDLSGDAANNANAGVASEMSSASAINYATSVVSGASAVDIDNTTVSAADDCTEANFGALFQSGSFPDGYTFTESDAAGAAGLTAHDCTAGVGTTVYCSVQRTNDPVGTAAVATLVCTGI